jgi:alkylated DNA repair dioxygenase AlkB
MENKLWLDTSYNLLPYDGDVNYFGRIMPDEQSSDFFNRLMKEIEWKNDEAIIFGRHIVTKRKVAWYGDSNFEYSYSKIARKALPWTEDLVKLKRIAEQKTGDRFNSCLLNLYHNGTEGMSWHSDNETTLEMRHAIASFSFGAERAFSFKHRRTGKIVSIVLEDGSLLVMKGKTQENWLHSLPKSRAITRHRINLTFRKIVEPPGN